MRKTFEPISSRVDDMYQHYEKTRAAEQIAQLQEHLTKRATDFPVLSAHSNAAGRVFTQWEALRKTAELNKAARPTHHDLEKIMQTEEAYLGSVAGRPSAAAGPPEVVRVDAGGRVPGLPIPGSGVMPSYPSATGYQSPQPGAPTSVATVVPMPGSPTALPGQPVAVPANEVMTEASLTRDITAQAASMGVQVTR